MRESTMYQFILREGEAIGLERGLNFNSVEDLASWLG
jgi:predicted transposase YdaD